MKKLFYIFIFYGFILKGQTFSMLNGDTINFIDINGKKQGKWIIHGKDRSNTCYASEQIIETGIYKNSRKEGIWIEYYCNGNIKNQLTFVGGRPDGSAVTYHQNGKINKEGTWKASRWIGPYKEYDSTGVLFRQCEMKPALTPSKYSSCPVGEPTKRDSLVIGCSFSQENLNGYHILYNKLKLMTKQGYFVQGRLIDGKACIYDDEGGLVRISIYKAGQYSGEEEIKK